MVFDLNLSRMLKDLQKRAWSVAQCQRMFKEIQEGERQLSETETDVQNLRSLLGLGSISLPLRQSYG